MLSYFIMFIPISNLNTVAHKTFTFTQRLSIFIHNNLYFKIIHDILLHVPIVLIINETNIILKIS